MAIYRKKPLTVHAIQWFPNMDLDYVKECGVKLPEPENTWRCVGKFWNELHDMELEVKPGGWIVDAGNGDLYPCDESVFASTFDFVSDN